MEVANSGRLMRSRERFYQPKFIAQFGIKTVDALCRFADGGVVIVGIYGHGRPDQSPSSR
jgi:hypothetical protein